MSKDKVNLVPAIKEIEKLIEGKKKEYQKEIEPYVNSLKLLRQINTACEFCNGAGKILRSRSCAEDDRPDPNNSSDYNPCPICNGTGNQPKIMAG